MPGLIHDQGPLAWFVVAAYLVGALLAFRAAAMATGRERGFWNAAAVLLILLGINKQLDLQSDLTDFARAAARSEGWYGWRRDAQGFFLLFMALATLGATAFFWRWLRLVPLAARIAAMGMVILLAFILLRAASFHHIDRWVTFHVAGMRSGWWLELLGIGVIGCAAAWRSRSGERPALRR